MPNVDSILWFKTEFHQKIEAVIKNTPLTLDIITAIACQETGYLWATLHKKSLDTARILEFCVGDCIDAPRRSAFPKTKADLLAVPNGGKMFAIARKALEDMAHETNNAAFLKAINNPDKFCHGFGIFQYDLQFFKDEPDYFLNREYADFDKCLEKCLKELQHGLRRARLDTKSSLTDLEAAAVAIAYNTGGYNPSKGLKQGYFNGQKYYGEEFFDFLQLAHTVSVP